MEENILRLGDRCKGIDLINGEEIVGRFTWSTIGEMIDDGYITLTPKIKQLIADGVDMNTITVPFIERWERGDSGISWEHCYPVDIDTVEKLTCT